MKHYTNLFLLLFVSSVIAQTNYKVEYEQSKILYWGENLNERQKLTIEQYKKPTFFSLSISNSTSLYKEIDKISNEQSDVHVVMKTIGGFEQKAIYQDIEKNIKISELIMDNKRYLVNGSPIEYKWNILEEEEKEILGYKVIKAISNVDEFYEIEAWFAPKLNSPFGPNGYFGLPGIILELKQIIKSNPKSYNLFYATEIEETSETNIKRPTKGQKINQSEFEELVNLQEEKIKEMFGDGVDKD